MSVAPPPRLLRALQRIGEAFNDRRCPWAVVGGLAVSIRLEPLDLQGLIANLTPVERQRALDAAIRIDAVGANRGRALRADLERRPPAP